MCTTLGELPLIVDSEPWPIKIGGISGLEVDILPLSLLICCSALFIRLCIFY